MFGKTKSKDRGRDGDTTPRPSLRTGRADFPHPALRLVSGFMAEGSWLPSKLLRG